jgi:hypothetical protein
MKTTPFDEFLRGYMAALWWSSTDCIPSDRSDSGQEEVVNLDQYDASEEAEAKCQADCEAFYQVHEADIDEAAQRYDLSRGDGADTGYDFAGHDFALTRNGHGTGFWDRPELKEGGLGDRLTKASKAPGEIHPYLGDDNLIYLE